MGLPKENRASNFLRGKKGRLQINCRGKVYNYINLHYATCCSRISWISPLLPSLFLVFNSSKTTAMQKTAPNTHTHTHTHTLSLSLYKHEYGVYRSTINALNIFRLLLNFLIVTHDIVITKPVLLSFYF